MTTYDVFLSHASADKPNVEALARRLRDDGLEPFLDKWHLIPGEPWQEALEEALEASRTCAVFVGARLGPWQNEEMRAALDERARDGSFRVIPVLLPGALMPGKKDLPRFLRRLTWVELGAGLDDDDAYHRLVCGIRGVPPDADSAPPAALAGKSGLERWAIGLGLVVALLAVAGGVLDLPGKWQAWRADVSSPAPADKQVLHGRVLDDASGLPLAGVQVEIAEHGLKTTTDASGVFSLEVPVPQYAKVRVSVRMEGFVTREVDPMLGTGQFEMYRLKEKRE